ncbi:DNA-3-methyladenine glycosylase [Mucilaginibacter sp. SG564]|uniref:DNA-3-methyladenine glycosylase family protein n=1 Tax=Mucilaginibacter sp. SG564 TaxID=2587022 RepID=UPI001554B5AF|nr:DNA-3-methyladenine glycosylase 2 family protein [Mucilaginibacter sp. SG564]NOW96063.1 DNA-3-methyladenine glycosylase II [Mucilaginibacter sp. SG564]
MKSIIKIKRPELFSFQECLWFIHRDFDDSLILIDEESVSRAIRVNGKYVPFTVSESDEYILIELNTEDLEVAPFIQSFVEDWLDLKRDLMPFYKILSQHPELSYMTEEFKGLRLIGNPETFETLIWSIISQQINMTFAFKLKRALIQTYGGSIDYDGKKLMLFPPAEMLQNLTIENLQALQFSRQKSIYIINAATAFASGELSKSILLAVSSQERVQKLTALKGVGLWTANAVIMQSLNDPTGLPLGDVGLLRALENHKLINGRADMNGVNAVFDRFNGWQAYLVNYLWRSLSKPLTSPVAVNP